MGLPSKQGLCNASRTPQGFKAENRSGDRRLKRDQDVLRRAVRDMFCRANKCIEVEGRHIERLLKKKCIEVEGRHIEVEGRHIEVEGRHIEVEGRHIEVEGRHIEVEGRHIEVEGRHIEVEGRHIEVEGRHIERLLEKM